MNRFIVFYEISLTEIFSVTFIQCDAIRWEYVFAEMSSWTPLTWYTFIKTVVKTNNIKRQSFGIFIILRFNTFRLIEEFTYLKKNST